jgi:hypothetical protein
MKTSILSLFALTISAALAIPVQAGGSGHGGGGGIGISGGGGHISSPAHSGGSSFRAAPGPNFGGGRFVAPGQRFSSFGMHSSPALRSQRFAGSNRAYMTRPQVASESFNHRGDRLGSRGNQPGGFNGKNHVFAHHSANWHRDWDRSRDHWWHGHRCRFINGEWFIFDLGFYPWYPYDYYPYDYYPYDYYPYDYYPYQYNPGGDGEYYSEPAYDRSEENADSDVVAAQTQLREQHYYRGEIDGVYGAATRRAVMRYQSDHGLRVTGRLNMDTLHALGLPRVASN